MILPHFPHWYRTIGRLESFSNNSDLRIPILLTAHFAAPEGGDPAATNAAESSRDIRLQRVQVFPCDRFAHRATHHVHSSVPTSREFNSKGLPLLLERARQVFFSFRTLKKHQLALADTHDHGTPTFESPFQDLHG